MYDFRMYVLMVPKIQILRTQRYAITFYSRQTDGPDHEAKNGRFMLFRGGMTVMNFDFAQIDFLVLAFTVKAGVKIID